MDSINIEFKKHGLLKIHYEYEVYALRAIWNSDEGLTSRDVWKLVNEEGGIRISRASIINFLQDMLDKGVLKAVEEPCKGGTRKRYSPNMSESEYKKHIVKTVLQSFLDDFSEAMEAVKEVME